jgi:hypothetical protein
MVVMSDDLWKRRFASDASIVGKKITINSFDWEVIGVMPAGFSLPSKETDLWLPWDIARTYNAQRFPKGPPRDWRFLHTVGRIKQDVSAEETQTRLSSFFRPEVFIPHAQNPYLPMNLVVRTASDPNRLIEPVKAQVREMDPAQAVSNVRTMDTLVSRSVATDRFSMWLLGLLGTLALALAATGLFSLLSYLVSQRTHEIGVRMALGARHGDIFRLVIGQRALLLAVGLAIGLGASFICARLLSSLLFGISAIDPLTFMFTPALLSVAALLACYVPARRATKADPMVALRSD